MKYCSARPGYIFLITVLIVGAIASVIAASLLLLATTGARSTLTLQQGAQALANAQTCAERALLEAGQDGTYAGGETLTLQSGTCRILTINGSGAENRTVCAEGMMGSTIRRLEIVVSELLPAPKIASWKEVPGFTLCSL